MSVMVKSANIMRAKNGSFTLKVNLDDQQSFFLHSTYNPEQEAQEWLRNICLQPKTAYVVFGIGLGYHIKALLSVLPEESHVFSIESSTNGSFLKVVKKSDPKASWVSDKRFTPLVGNEMHDMSGIINKTMQREGIKRITLCRHFPSMRICSDFYAEMEKELIKRAVELYKMDHSYQLAAGGEMMVNAWTNLPEIFKAPGISGLKNKFKGKPAIMVAGGPSLDKNIHILKENVDKAIIICAGSAMGTLHHYGITPHFLVAIDPFPGAEKVFDDCLNESTYLVTCYTVPHALVADYPGQKLFCKLQENTPNANTLNGIQHLLPETNVLYSNISVATTAVSLAIHMGADPIVFVGQDLSFAKDESTHAQGSKAFPIDEGPEEWVSVPGYYGGEVLTIPTFKIAIEFFTVMFSHVKEKQFINATEGGAYLEGAKHISLKEVVDQYMGDTIDVFNIVEKEISYNSEPDYKELLNFLRECIKSNDDLLQQGEELLVATERCPAMILAGDFEEAEQQLQKMKTYFEVVYTSPVYENLMTYLSPIMQSFFMQDDYADLEEKFLNYIAVFSYIRIALEKLNDLISISISNLEKNEKGG